MKTPLSNTWRQTLLAQPPGYPWDLRALLAGKPSVGMLLDLCEENYQRILTLAPGIAAFRGSWRSPLPHCMDLYLEILEQTPYTTLAHLTYFFDHASHVQPDPDATIRLYHDSRQAEVLELRQTALPLNRGTVRPTLEQKWKVNLFFSKWLEFCLCLGHRFDANDVGDADQPSAATSSC